MIAFLVILALVCLVVTGVCVFLGLAGLALKFICYVFGLVFNWEVLVFIFVFCLIVAIIKKYKDEKKDAK